MKFSLKVFIILLLVTSSKATVAQEQAFESIKNFIKPAKKDGGLKLSQYFLWCPSVIKVGNTYHMFASAWPAEGGMASWTAKSLCIRATSKNLLGPYEFAEVVLEKREGKWDNDRVHNPKIVKVGNKYVLYYISSANETGYAEADAITGPWTRSEKMMSFSNPAPLVKPDGSVYVFGRLSVKIGDKQVRTARAAEAASYKGPYQNLAPEKENLFPNNYELEDPTIWWANNQYNVICTDFAGVATGRNKVGVQYYSKDGINYQLLTKEPISTNEITYDDGSKEKFKRVERPFAYVENGVVKAYFLGCMTPDDKGVIVAHPVDDYVPGKSSSKKK
ncbi:glycoside hydrolase family protein [Pedobacter glucosidilyticus]|uniref:glycoside hydrolase family protein n=1 Tax=Pedobacter glucosidilyticus TaxID=1122941 RepID=UPI0003F7F6EF|nr:glycoside hydrolase family protein [Pedobacter glucosidilyticus]